MTWGHACRQSLYNQHTDMITESLPIVLSYISS